MKFQDFQEFLKQSTKITSNTADNKNFKLRDKDLDVTLGSQLITLASPAQQVRIPAYLLIRNDADLYYYYVEDTDTYREITAFLKADGSFLQFPATAETMKPLLEALKAMKETQVAEDAAEPVVVAPAEVPAAEPVVVAPAEVPAEVPAAEPVVVAAAVPAVPAVPAEPVVVAAPAPAPAEPVVVAAPAPVVVAAPPETRDISLLSVEEERKKLEADQAAHLLALPVPVKRELVSPKNKALAKDSAIVGAGFAGVWALCNLNLFQAAVSPLVFSALVVPAVAGLAIREMYIRSQVERFERNNPGVKPDDAAMRNINRDANFVMGNFVVAYAATQIVTHFALSALAKNLTMGSMISGSPLEAQLVMMAIAGVAFGATMMFMTAMKCMHETPKGEKTDWKAAAPAMLKSFAIGLLTGATMHAAGMIPGVNAAYGHVMPGWTASTLAVTGQFLAAAVPFAGGMLLTANSYTNQPAADKKMEEVVPADAQADAPAAAPADAPAAAPADAPAAAPADAPADAPAAAPAAAADASAASRSCFTVLRNWIGSKTPPVATDAGNTATNHMRLQ